MTDDPYKVVRHAKVATDPNVAWVSIARWIFENGTTEWTLEYWDRHGNDADRDAEFEDEAGAKAQAFREFGIREEDWRDGPEPARG
jgi:hypothetical protein